MGVESIKSKCGIYEVLGRSGGWASLATYFHQQVKTETQTCPLPDGPPLVSQPGFDEGQGLASAM
jgi:hypothetical protein